MQYFDISYFGSGIGVVIAFWFFGLVVSVVFGILRKIGFWILIFAFIYLFSSHPVVLYADDFINLPSGLDWSSAFGDIVALVSPFVLFAVGFGAYKIIRKVLTLI